MPTIERNRIRCAVDNILARGALEITDVLTGRALEIWQAEDVQVEAAFFNDGTIAADISNFASVTMEIKDPANLIGAPLLSKTALKTGSVAPQVDLDQTVSLANWDDGTEQHAFWVLTSTETNIELSGLPYKALTLFFWATTTDVPARRIPIAKSTIVLRDSGYGDLGAIVIQAPGARMSGSKMQILNQDDGLYYDAVLRNVSGSPTLSVEGAGVP